MSGTAHAGAILTGRAESGRGPVVTEHGPARRRRTKRQGGLGHDTPREAGAGVGLVPRGKRGAGRARATPARDGVNRETFPRARGLMKLTPRRYARAASCQRLAAAPRGGLGAFRATRKETGQGSRYFFIFLLAFFPRVGKPEAHSVRPSGTPERGGSPFSTTKTAMPLSPCARP